MTSDAAENDASAEAEMFVDYRIALLAAWACDFKELKRRVEKIQSFTGDLNGSAGTIARAARELGKIRDPFDQQDNSLNERLKPARIVSGGGKIIGLVTIDANWIDLSWNRPIELRAYISDASWYNVFYDNLDKLFEGGFGNAIRLVSVKVDENAYPSFDDESPNRSKWCEFIVEDADGTLAVQVSISDLGAILAIGYLRQWLEMDRFNSFFRKLLNAVDPE